MSSNPIFTYGIVGMTLVWYDNEEEYNWLASVLLDNGMGCIWLGKLNKSVSGNMRTSKCCTRTSVIFQNETFFQANL